MQTSNAGTKYMLTLATNHLNHLNEKLEQVKTATEIEVSYDFGPGKYVGKRWTHEQKTVMVVKGAEHPARYGEPGEMEDGVEVATDDSGKTYNNRVFVFEKVQAARIRDLMRNIKSVEGDITFLNKKIVDWTP